MATPADVARALTNLAEARAKRLDDMPTGVVPGYNAALGGTVNPNGTLRYVGTGIGVLKIDAIYTMSGTNTVLGDTTPKRLNFNVEVYDPLAQVTTGSSWAFTAAVGGTYIVLVNAPLSIGDAIDWVTADRADLSIQGAVNETICTWVGIPVASQPANLLLTGFYGFTLVPSDIIYAQIVQDCGTNRIVDSALASIIIAHV